MVRFRASRISSRSATTTWAAVSSLI
jgi:hypothetical protein